jgi:hypothetical protein
MNEIIYRISTCVSMPPHGFIVTVDIGALLTLAHATMLPPPTCGYSSKGDGISDGTSDEKSGS